jgi:hypothetical protein
MSPLAARLSDGVIGADGSIEPDRLSDLLLIPMSELRDVVGLQLLDVSAPAEWTSPSVQDRLRQIVQILDFILPWCGSAPQAFAWFHSQPIPSFGGRTADGVVREGHGDHVLSYLEGLAAGGFA